MPLQNIADRMVGKRMPEISQRADHPLITPAWVGEHQNRLPAAE